MRIYLRTASRREDEMLRIISGEFGGRKISVPKGSATRPTADRVREALFSSLGPLHGMRALDLFAGSGAFGLEAVSRGAESSVLVDSDRAAKSCLDANVAILDVAEVVRVIHSDWLVAVSRLAAAGDLFDVVMVDPPYRDAVALGERLASVLLPVLAEGATVICESSVKDPMETELTLLREKRYGDTLIRFYGTR
ncbi:MAG: 16S rRNA (guanine(966)-N(2))-methyltransferase RsmD [Actinomycetes bacterium]